MEERKIHSVLAHTRNAYFIGIKGVGMTAFAQILQHRGVNVVGSDTDEVFFTDEVLRSLSIPFFESFDAEHITSSLPLDLVVTSPAYVASDNVEIQEVQKRNIPLIVWHQGLAEIFNASKGVAVCGTHGKSTTTAMIGTILEDAGLDPTVVVGSRVNAWGSNARVGSSDIVVVEADEYKESFLHYYPSLIAITNIEYDHPDYFTTPEQYNEAFVRFMKQASGSAVIRTPQHILPLQLSLPGQYNQQNASLACAVAVKLGVEPEVAEQSVSNFQGLARRFESYGTYKGALLYDDYAHHPSEIRALFQGLREKFPDRTLVFLFQSHTYSRTKAFFDDFVNALQEVDEAYILKTYSSAREQEADEVGQKLASALQTRYFDSHRQAIEYFSDFLDDSHFLCSVGAGDGWGVVDALRALK